MLTLEELLRHDAGKTPQQVPTPVDDDNLQDAREMGGRERSETIADDAVREKSFSFSLPVAIRQSAGKEDTMRAGRRDDRARDARCSCLSR